jgi:hypothetical protein
MIHSYEKIAFHGIGNSGDLALVLNAPPGTTGDPDTVDPRDNSGVWVLQRSGATFYPFDPGTTTETLAVLADGTAAAELINDRWSPADTDEYEDVDPSTGVVSAGVTMDWRSVRVWDVGGFDETTIYATPAEARTYYDTEVDAMRRAASAAAER